MTAAQGSVQRDGLSEMRFFHLLAELQDPRRGDRTVHELAAVPHNRGVPARWARSVVCA